MRGNITCRIYFDFYPEPLSRGRGHSDSRSSRPHIRAKGAGKERRSAEHGPGATGQGSERRDTAHGGGKTRSGRDQPAAPGTRPPRPERYPNRFRPANTIRRKVPHERRLSVRSFIPNAREDQNGSPTETVVQTPPEEGWYTESLKVEVAEAGWRKMLKSTTTSPPTDQMRRRSVSVIPTSRNWA